jgi:hypothetical protein
MTLRYGAYSRLAALESRLREMRIGLVHYGAEDAGRQLGFDRVWGERGFGLAVRAAGRSEALLDVDDDAVLVWALGAAEAFLASFEAAIYEETARVQGATSTIQALLRELR